MYTGEADWTLIGEVKNNPRMHILLSVMEMLQLHSVHKNASTVTEWMPL